MKKKRLLFMLLGTLLLGIAGKVSATEVENYTMDFNTTINVSQDLFKVATNWGHIGEAYTEDGTDYYMKYTYYTSAGEDSTPCLYAGEQRAYANTYSNGQSVIDILVTPKVKGAVTLRVKRTASSAYLYVYSINDDGTKGEKLLSFEGTDLAAETYTWYTITLANLEDYARIGIRGNYVYMDNFAADYADLEDEPGLSITAVSPQQSTGVYSFNQLPNGNVEILFNATLKNTGTVDLTTDTEGYSVTVFRRKQSSIAEAEMFTVPISQDLAVGESLENFEVRGEIDPSEYWSGSTIYIDLRENVSSSSITGVNAQYNKYEPDCYVREQGVTYTSDYYKKTIKAFGSLQDLTGSDATYALEMVNIGIAPMTIKSVSVPDGFSVTGLPEDEFTVEASGTQTFSINFAPTAVGAYSGDVVFTYEKNGEDATYTISVSGVYVDPNAWTCDFGTTNTVPTGCIKGGGMTFDYSGYNPRDYYIYSSSSSSNKYFITPKLIVSENSSVCFDIKRKYATNPYVSVYLTKDRSEWGEAVATVNAASVSTSSWETQIVNIPVAEQGEYYVVFEISDVYFDNIVGPQKADVNYDIYIEKIAYPSATIQSGTAQSITLTATPILDIAAENYTVEFLAKDSADEAAEYEVVSTATSVTYTGGSTSRTFKFSWTPTVSKTTVFSTYARISYDDGTSVETAPQEMTVYNEPIFKFIAKSTSASLTSEPTTITTPVSYGTVSEPVMKEYSIYNFGTAPLTVNSVAVSEGFSLNEMEFPLTVESDQRQAVEITFSATTPDMYNGELTIVYLNGSGEEQTYTLALSGTLLDSSKFYTTFGGSTVEWPAGSVYQSNVSDTTPETGVRAIYSSSSSNNMFITPKLHVEENENIQIEARTYSTNWPEGTVKIYAAASRDELASEDSRTLLCTVSGQNVEEPYLASTSVQSFMFSMPEEGDYYLGFELSGRLYLYSIYGGEVVEVEHELEYASVSIPTKVMPNVATTGTISIRNFGIHVETSETYTVQAFVNGEKVTDEAGSVEIALSHKATDAGTAVPVTFSYGQSGDFPVYLQVTAGENVYSSETVTVTFLEAGKWYTEFEQSTGASSFSTYPAGTVRESSVQGSYDTVDGEKVWYITANSATSNNMFVSPKLHAKAGDELQLNAKLYSTGPYYLSGGVAVYASPTREGLSDESARVYIGKISGDSSDESLKLTSTYADCTLTVSEDFEEGDYYIGFVLTNYVHLHSIFGFEPVDVAHDLSISSFSLPTTVQQGSTVNASVVVKNYGMSEEAAESYNVSLYVDGEEVDSALGSVAIPVSYTFTESGVTVSLETSLENIGEYSVFVRVSIDDYYVDSETIQVSVLDPNMWYTEFDQGTATYFQTYPEGSTRESNISGSSETVNGEKLWYITAYSYTVDNMFVAPKLHAEAGETIRVSAKLASGNAYTAGCVAVYAAATRAELADADARISIGTLSGESEDASMKLSSDLYKGFTLSLPESMEAGDYYFGFVLTNNVHMHGIYGLERAEVGHDLYIASSTIPETGMQNTQYTASIGILNFGENAEAAESYSVSLFVDGEEVASTVGSSALPTTAQYSSSKTNVSLTARCPKVGTYPVFMRLTLDDVVLDSAPVEVTFAEEVLSAEVQVGTVSGNNNNAPVYLIDKNAEVLMLYTADQLGLEDGAKISKVYFKGYFTETSKTVTSNVKVYYQLVDDKTLSSPASGLYDSSEMSLSWEKDAYSWPITSATMDEYLTLDFSENPLVYESGKALKIMVQTESGTNWTSSYQFEKSNLTGNIYKHSSDTASTYQSNSWSSVSNLPVLYLALMAEPTQLSGNVVEDGAAVEGAVVTLVSTDGDNVQYSGKTDAEGNYSINVIQNSRSYDVTAKANDKLDFVLDQKYEGEAVQDFDLMDYVDLSEGVKASDKAIVKVDLGLEPGYNAVVLPFDMSQEEADELFGEWCEILHFQSSMVEDGNLLHMYFWYEEDGMKAGVPYMINATQATSPMYFRGKQVSTSLQSKADDNMSFVGTYSEIPMESGMFKLSDGDFVEVNANARSVETVAPYSAYVKVSSADVDSVVFSVEEVTVDGIETISADMIDENAVIYNLQGMRLKKASHGVYIVDGKKVMVVR